MDARWRRAAGVSSGDVGQPHLPARRRRRDPRDQQVHGQGPMATKDRRTVGLDARRGGRHGICDRALALAGAAGRTGGGAEHDRRAPALGERPAESSRVLSLARQRQAFLRLSERHRVCVECAHWQRALDLPRSWSGQGQPEPGEWGALLRRLLGRAAGRARARRPSAVGERVGRSIGGQRHVLFDTGGDVWTSVSRQHRRARIRIRRVLGQTRLGCADRRLRVRLASRHQRAWFGADHIPGLLRRHVLCTRRSLRTRRLALSRRRQDLRLGHNRRADRLFRQPRPPHDRAWDLNRQSGVLDENGLVRPRHKRRPLPVPVGHHRPVRARPLRSHVAAQGCRGEGFEGGSRRKAQPQPPASPSARASEKRAATRTTPAALALTTVQPPRVAETQPCPLTTVQ